MVHFYPDKVCLCFHPGEATGLWKILLNGLITFKDNFILGICCYPYVNSRANWIEPDSSNTGRQ